MLKNNATYNPLVLSKIIHMVAVDCAILFCVNIVITTLPCREVTTFSKDGPRETQQVFESVFSRISDWSIFVKKKASVFLYHTNPGEHKNYYYYYYSFSSNFYSYKYIIVSRYRTNLEDHN